MKRLAALVMMVFLFTLVCSQNVYAEVDDIFVWNAESDGTYIYNYEGEIAGYLLNGCPIDVSLIKPVEIEQLNIKSNEYLYYINCEYIVDKENINMQSSLCFFPEGVLILTDHSNIFRLYPSQEDSQKTVEISERDKFRIYGRVSDYYYILYNEERGYISQEHITFNPTHGRRGRAYTKNLLSYILLYTDEAITGDEEINFMQAQERTLNILYHNKLIMSNSDTYELSINFRSIKKINIGYCEAWEVVAEVGDKEYIVLIDTKTGADIYCDFFSEDFG